MRMCVLTACLSAHHLPTYCLLKQEAVQDPLELERWL